MVKSPLSSPFSAQQNIALSLLGYKRWLPQDAVRAYHQAHGEEKSAPLSFSQLTQNLVQDLSQDSSEARSDKNSHENLAGNKAPTQKLLEPSSENDDKTTQGSGRAEFPSFRAAPPTSAHQTASADQTENRASPAKIITLANSDAQIAICRDYALLLMPKSACDWLLPPLWTREGKLQCFALPIEQQLWLAALQSVDFKEIAQYFTALFATDIPVFSAPNCPLITMLEERKKPVIICGEMAGLSVPDAYIMQRLLHPIVMLTTQSKKRELWQQLLTLKEKIF